MSKESKIDVVIPAHSKDAKTLAYAIEGVKRNVVDHRRIIVVSKYRLSNEAEWFDEALYPFSYEAIENLMNGQNVGWNYQQLLKFYAAFVIPDIGENILILDADTVFYRRVRFFDNGLPLYNLSKDINLESDIFYKNSSNHISKLLPQINDKLPEVFVEKKPESFAKKLNFLTSFDQKNAVGLLSGICHHMIFQKSLLKKLFLEVETVDGSGDEFFNIFLKTSSQTMGVSEYNLYFYFLAAYCQNSFKVRILNYKNTGRFFPFLEKIRKKYDYCSYHSYLQKKAFLSFKTLFK